MMNRMPALFVGHGSPMNAIEDNPYSRAWSALGQSLEKPKAIVSISAHWFTRGTKINDEESPSMVYDMYGFPEELYQVKYPAKGSPELADRVSHLLGSAVSIDNHWGIDHGAWSVLRRMFPAADVPILPLSVNAQLAPEDHFSLGKRLMPLRDDGVLILGSGNVVHNLARIDWRKPEGTPWAEEFDQYIYRAVTTRSFNDAINYLSAGDSAELAVPSLDHFLPLLYVLGASDESDQISAFNQDCLLGSLSMTSYLFSNTLWSPKTE
ncbi:MAG: 4,5-DOPA dioxygenase extradiol [Christensenella sp.]|nr:4,5-DOPA dioxygenase extradiol [Christensenella sp.]